MGLVPSCERKRQLGHARKRRELFFKSHPTCIFCGGGEKATTFEHCPPRAMFQEKKWPEGFEFPSCARCNNGTSDQDLLIAMLARIDPFGDAGDSDGRMSGLMHGVNRQFPGLFSKMTPSATEARRSNRELRITPGLGKTHQECSAVKVTDEIHTAVSTFSGKLAKGIYYMNSGKIFPRDGCLLLNWFTNANLFKDGKYEPFETLKDISGDMPPIRRAGRYLNEQFEFKLSMSQDFQVFVVQAIFGKSFGIVVFGATIAGALESVVLSLRERTQREGPFTVLESPSLPIGRPRDEVL